MNDSLDEALEALMAQVKLDALMARNDDALVMFAVMALTIFNLALFLTGGCTCP